MSEDMTAHRMPAQKRRHGPGFLASWGVNIAIALTALLVVHALLALVTVPACSLHRSLP